MGDQNSKSDEEMEEDDELPPLDTTEASSNKRSEVSINDLTR